MSQRIGITTQTPLNARNYLLDRFDYRFRYRFPTHESAQLIQLFLSR